MIPGIITTLILYAAVIILAEVLYRRGFPADITRKITHIGGGLVSFCLPFLLNLQTVVILGLLFSFLLFWTRKKQLLKSVHEARNESVGAVLFPIGLALSAILFWRFNPLIFQGSTLILGLSDGIAGIYGKKLGKKKYNITGLKTLEGSFIFFTITLLIVFFIFFAYRQTLTVSDMLLIVSGSIFLTFVEGLLGKGLDNLFVPIAGGFILFLLLKV